jgi:hypothetical protein
MADKPKSGSPAAPSFYSAAAGMDGGKKPGPGGPEGGAGTPEGQSGEKVKNVEVLLEVFQKMDKLEQDPDNKAMIQSMVDQAKKYLDKLKGMDTGKGPAAAPPTGEAGSGGPGAGSPPPPDAAMGGGAPGAAA